MITQTVTTSFKSEMLQAGQNLLTDTLKIALYTSLADLNADTTVYTATGEITGTGYSAGGKVLTGVTLGSSNNVVFVNFDNAVWTPASFTARGALIYNSTQSNKSIAVLDFGADKTATNTFTVQMPANTYTSALLRF